MNEKVIADFLESRQLSRRVEVDKRADELARRARLKDLSAGRLQDHYAKLYRASSRIGETLLAAETSSRLGKVSEKKVYPDHVRTSRLLILDLGEILLMRTTMGRQKNIKVYNLTGANDTLDYLGSAVPASPKQIDLAQTVEAESSYDTFRTVYGAAGLPQLGNLPKVPSSGVG